MPQLCNHGLIELNKYGTEQRNGLTYCLGCGNPTADSWAEARSRATPPQPSTPLDRARAARQRGDTFFEIQLEIGRSSRDVSFLEGDSGSRSERDHAQTLGAIEAEGWKLEQAGYVFVPTGESSRMKMLGTGESVAVSGVTVGIYLFRLDEARLPFDGQGPA
jgi:hypothetical protein